MFNLQKKILIQIAPWVMLGLVGQNRVELRTFIISQDKFGQKRGYNEELEIQFSYKRTDS